MPLGDGFGPAKVGILPAQKFGQLHKIAAVGRQAWLAMRPSTFHPYQKGIHKELGAVWGGLGLILALPRAHDTAS